ncbi:hypothetical protein D3C85_1339150 [compost metagenome]
MRAIQAGPLHVRHVGEVGLRSRRGIHHAGNAQDNAAALGDVDVGAVDSAQLTANQFEIHAAVVRGAVLVQHAGQRQAAELGWQVIEEGDVEGTEVAAGITVADGDGETDGIALVIATQTGG